MHNNNEIRKRYPKFFIATVTVITAVMLLGTTAISTLTPAESVFAYRSSQATSQINDCGNGFSPEDVGCQNTGSQIQGDKNSVALSSQQTFPSQEPPPPPERGILEVKKEVRCPAGITCPPPSDFEMRVTGNNPIPATFDGSSAGTEVDIGTGSYSVDETVPTLPPGQTLTETRSADCSGTINAGESKTCTITNTITIEPPTTATLTVKKIVECVEGQVCEGLPSPSDFQMFVVFGASVTPAFPGSSEGTPVTIEPGSYFVFEGRPLPPGLDFVESEFSDGCSGIIMPGEERTCTVTNIYEPTAV